MVMTRNGTECHMGQCIRFLTSTYIYLIHACALYLFTGARKRKLLHSALCDIIHEELNFQGGCIDCFYLVLPLRNILFNTT